MAERAVVGWDIGGAHVKACLLRHGLVHDVAQWPCPLWQGIEHLERVLALAHRRWPGLADAQHAVTMTGEMVDLFAHREDGVRRIATLLDEVLGAPRFFAGDAGWCETADMAGALGTGRLGQLAGQRAPRRAGTCPTTRACWSTSAAPPPT